MILPNSLRLLRSHGMTVTSWDRDKGRPAHYDVLEVGFNFRFDDIRAAIGLVQLEKLPQFNSQRADLVNRYNEQFSKSNSGRDSAVRVSFRGTNSHRFTFTRLSCRVPQNGTQSPKA